jgi:hypothetical protein
MVPSPRFGFSCSASARPLSTPTRERRRQRHRVWIGPVGERIGHLANLGEATVNSAPFYEKLLAVRPVQDLFIIEAPEMTAIAERQKHLSHPPLASKAARGLH